MIEDNGMQPVQAAFMEASVLLAEAVELAERLGFTLVACGGTVDVIPWDGKPLRAHTGRDIHTGGICEFEYLDNLIDWLHGVSYGRTNVKWGAG